MEQNVRVTLGSVQPGPGPEFAVKLVEAGPSKNGYTFPAAVLERAAPLFEGVTAFVDHTWSKSVRDVCGSFHDARFDPQPSAFSLHPSMATKLPSIAATFRPAGPMGEYVAALVRQILADRQAGLSVPDVGLSADLWLACGDDLVVTEIGEVISVDVVFNPAAGGAFEKVVDSVNTCKGGNEMSEKVSGQAGQLSGQLLQMQCESVLESKLAATDLPAPFIEHIRGQFAGRTFTPAELSQAIEGQRRIWAQVSERQVIRGVGPVQVQDGMDRLRLAVDHLFGLPARGDFEKLSGIRELYLMLTGDHEFRGSFHPERVRFANATTSTMAELVRNVMNKSVLAQYEKLGQAGYLWWKRIVHEEDFSSVQPISWITVGGFDDLPTVDEGGDYTELTWDDAHESPTWAKKGGYIGLTLEMLDRDETQKVRQLPVLLATAAIRTVSNLVAALFSTVNSTGSPTGYGPTLVDGGAAFNSTIVTTTGGHANLGSSALSAAQWDTVLQAMFKQPELNSSKRLGIKPRFCLVPIELEKTALTIFTSQGEPATPNNDANVRQGAAADVIVVPEWTDANDWAAVADPALAPGIGVGYRFGRQPEVFISGDPLVGSMFTNDEMRLKARFMVAVHVINWRPLYFSHL